MSASFPNSWEPYGSSQQSQALAWRKPATRPAHQTFSQRWKAAHASAIRPLPTTPLKPFVKPPQPKPAPAPPAAVAPSSCPEPQKKALDLASFHAAEHEHRLLARYESVRGEIRDVTAAVNHLSDNIHLATRTNHQTHKLLREEIASLHATFVTIEDKLSKPPPDNATEQLLKRVIADLLNPLSHSIQNNIKALNTLDESHTRLSARVTHMADGLFDRIANLVRHQFQNAFDTHFAPLLDRRIRTTFEQHRQTLDTFLERLEDRINISIVPYLQQHNHFPSGSNHDDHRRLQDDSYVHSERDRHQRAPVQSFKFREESVPRYESRPQTYERDSRECKKASDFDVTTCDDARDDGRPSASGSPLTQRAFDRAQQKASRAASTHAGSGSGCDPSSNPIWARLRIRQKKFPGEGKTTAKAPVIDLTKETDSDVGEETNFFEDSRMQCKNEALELPLKCYSSNSETSMPPSESSLDAEAWSPEELQPVENEKLCIRKPRHCNKSPYFTRSSKKRRRI